MGRQAGQTGRGQSTPDGPDRAVEGVVTDQLDGTHNRIFAYQVYG
jgi:hypothetical protein